MRKVHSFYIFISQKILLQLSVEAAGCANGAEWTVTLVKRREHVWK